MKSTIVRRSRLAFLILCMTCSAATAQDVISIRSGNGTAGGPDAAITRLDAPPGGFLQVFTPTDFAAAQIGPPAEIVLPAGGWATSLANDPSAQWISTSQLQGSQVGALYAIFFNISVPVLTEVTLDIEFLVDDFLGNGINGGLYVNNFPVPSSSTSLVGGWFIEQSFQGIDITSLVNIGINTLFINQDNPGIGGAGGLCFTATIRAAGPVDLVEIAPLVAGGNGLLELRAQASQAGFSYLVLPAVLPALPVGSGFSLQNGSEFRLSPLDPLLQLTLVDPAAGGLIVGSTGSISPVNNTAWTLVSLPASASLTGMAVNWQAVVLDPLNAATTLEASNVLLTVIQ